MTKAKLPSFRLLGTTAVAGLCVTGAASAESLPAVVEVPFEWAAGPSAAVVEAAFPAGSLGPGTPVFNCTVGADGRLLDCQDERSRVSPTELRAARSLLAHYRVALSTSQGLRTRGLQVKVVIRFSSADKTEVDAGGTIFTEVPWAAEPDEAALSRVYPPSGESTVLIHLRCQVNAAGGLDDCAAFGSDDHPTARERALGLAPLYRVPAVSPLGLRTDGMTWRFTVHLDPPSDGPAPPRLRVVPPRPPSSVPLLVGALAGPSPEPKARARTIRTDTASTVLQFLNADAGCAAAAVDVSVVESPAHGQVVVEDAVTLVGSGRVAANDPRRACLPAPLAGKRVIYLPEPGYVGADSVVVRVASNGLVVEERTDFSIQP